MTSEGTQTCNTLPVKPFYQDESVTIYNTDCRRILPLLPQFDLLLTDPPYGIGSKWKGGGSHGWGNAKSQTKARNEWDMLPPAPWLIHMAVESSKKAIVWGGNYFDLPPARCFLVWNKPERNFTLAEAEYAWTNIDNVARVCDCRRSDPGRTHPTQKPLALMRWCLTRSWSRKAETILDPFAGAGTTGVAAKLEGRKAVLVEASESHCEDAADRLRQIEWF